LVHASYADATVPEEINFLELILQNNKKHMKTNIKKIKGIINSNI
tara:strand:- start:442 stop:576 length:135 start_codon:yes stop_codon:yes gene_type:complete